MAGRWLDVQSAAQELGISTDAVRKRIARGTLPSEERDRRRVVWLDTGGTEAGQEPTDTASSPDRELVDTLRSQVDDLREQLRAEREANRENRRLLAAALERIPELEPGPQEQSEPAVSRAPESDPGSGPDSPSEDRERGSQRSVWKRLFGRG